MNSTTIFPSTIIGSIVAPASKSYSQRACAAALLKGGQTILTNYGNSNDEKIALEIIKQLGAKVECIENKIIINSVFNTNDSNSCTHLFVDESGLSLRMFTPIASLLSNPILINGSGSLLNRTTKVFDDILPQLNVSIQSNHYKLPLKIQGVIKMQSFEIDGEISSQFLSGFLMAYSFLTNHFLLKDDVVITVNNLKSKPYIDVTLDVLQHFGLPIAINHFYKEFVFEKNKLHKKNTETIFYNIEGDWSSAAFLLVAGAVAGEIIVKNINTQSKQADKKIIEALLASGCVVEFKENEIKLNSPQNSLQAFKFDATDCPDLFPPLVALAANCNGISTIKGVNRLKHKESNRGIALQQEFAKMGVSIIVQNDEMVIEGTQNMVGATVHSHNDHRIAMACVVAALNAKNKVVIEGVDAVNKSYPYFYKDLQSVGMVIK